MFSGSWLPSWGTAKVPREELIRSHAEEIQKLKDAHIKEMDLLKAHHAGTPLEGSSEAQMDGDYFDLETSEIITQLKAKIAEMDAAHAAEIDERNQALHELKEEHQAGVADFIEKYKPDVVSAKIDRLEAENRELTTEVTSLKADKLKLETELAPYKTRMQMMRFAPTSLGMVGLYKKPNSLLVPFVTSTSSVDETANTVVSSPLKKGIS